MLLHSPPQIYDIERKKTIRGGLNIVFFGDTKTGKSQIGKDITNKGDLEGFCPVGEYCVVETGGRTGFLYTIDTDKNALIWGSVVLNDLGLVVLDGLQSLHSEEMGEFRETLETQEVSVKRSVKGTALARTRIIACMNPGKKDDKPMSHYIYKCQAITDSWVFCKSPDITRFDLFIPFSKGDVPSSEIAGRSSGERPIPKDIFERHVFWSWSRKPQDITYTDSMIKKIKEVSEDLINTYAVENLPVVHMGMREVLTRLSVSKACELHSVNGTHEKVIVESAHVERAVAWYKKLLDLLQLKEYKDDLEGKSKLTDQEIVDIMKDLTEHHFQILDSIKFGAKGSEELALVCGISSRMVKEYYGKLKYHELVETRPGVGIMLTLKGIKFLSWGQSFASEIGKKNFTNENNGEGKVPDLTNWGTPP